MADPQTPPAGNSPPGAPPGDPNGPIAVAPPAKGPTEEVSLEDLDRLIDEEDPEFAKVLAEMRLIETDTSIEIESSVDTDENPSATPAEPATVRPASTLTGIEKYKQMVKDKLREMALSLKAQALEALNDCWASMKTWPKHSWKFIKETSQAGYKQVMIPITAVGKFSRAQKILLTACVAFVVLGLILFFANLRGIWLPYLNEPILGSFEEVAQESFAYDTKNDVSVFYAAFPKEPHEFLLGKIKVNLKRTADHPNPMGAFEVIVSVDSKDTAIELGSREVEFNDLTQRVIEDEAFETLNTEIGKLRFKSRLKREISNKLTQGWVKEINFKTFVLKP